jgi:hypothetical protein
MTDLIKNLKKINFNYLINSKKLMASGAHAAYTLEGHESTGDVFGAGFGAAIGLFLGVLVSASISGTIKLYEN